DLLGLGAEQRAAVVVLVQLRQPGRLGQRVRVAVPGVLDTAPVGLVDEGLQLVRRVDPHWTSPSSSVQTVTPHSSSIDMAEPCVSVHLDSWPSGRGHTSRATPAWTIALAQSAQGKRVE